MDTPSHPNELAQPAENGGSPAKPIAVWVMIAVCGALTATGTFWTIKHAVAGSLVNAMILASVSAYWAVTASTIYRGRKLGRALGTLLILFVALLAVFGPGGPTPRCSLSSHCVSGWWAGRLSMGALVLAFAYPAGWSRNARAYYGERVKRAEGDV